MGRNLPWSIIPASEDQYPAGRPHSGRACRDRALVGLDNVYSDRPPTPALPILSAMQRSLWLGCLRSPQDAHHALVADPGPFPRLRRRGNGPERSSLRPQSRHFANPLLLGLVRDEFTVIATPETEGDLAAEIRAPRLLKPTTIPIYGLPLAAATQR
jgi:hypothetical protein